MMNVIFMHHLQQFKECIRPNDEVDYFGLTFNPEFKCRSSISI